MMKEREAKRRSAAARSGIDAHLAAAGTGTGTGPVGVKRVRKLPRQLDGVNVRIEPHVANRSIGPARPGPPCLRQAHSQVPLPRTQKR